MFSVCPVAGMLWWSGWWGDARKRWERKETKFSTRRKFQHIDIHFLSWAGTKSHSPELVLRNEAVPKRIKIKDFTSSPFPTNRCSKSVNNTDFNQYKMKWCRWWWQFELTIIMSRKRRSLIYPNTPDAHNEEASQYLQGTKGSFLEGKNAKFLGPFFLHHCTTWPHRASIVAVVVETWAYGFV